MAIVVICFVRIILCVEQLLFISGIGGGQGGAAAGRRD
jgi:hypothetical protein